MCDCTDRAPAVMSVGGAATTERERDTAGVGAERRGEERGDERRAEWT